MKRILFFFTSLVLIATFILITDFFLSNTFLKKESCFNYGKFYYELKKNCNGKEKFKKSFPTVNIYTNDLGLRTLKNSKQKENLNQNIFIFGDSFAYGTGLKYKESFVGLMEKKLVNYNFYNFSVSSYSPSVYLYKLNKMIDLGIKPKKVFVFLDLSDVLDEVNRWDFDSAKNTIKTKISEENNHFRNDEFKQKNFLLLNEFASIINFNLRILKSKIRNSFYTDGKNLKIMTTFQGSFTYKEKSNLDKRFWKNEDLEIGLKKIKNVIRRIEKLSFQNDSEFYLVVYPWAETLQYGQKAFNWSKFASTLCKFENCKLINAIPKFESYKKRNKNWNNKLYFINDVNFNKEGSKLLYEFVLSKISF